VFRQHVKSIKIPNTSQKAKHNNSTTLTTFGTAYCIEGTGINPFATILTEQTKAQKIILLFKL
jgi:hypothetical protein